MNHPAMHDTIHSTTASKNCTCVGGAWACVQIPSGAAQSFDYRPLTYMDLNVQLHASHRSS